MQHRAQQTYLDRTEACQYQLEVGLLGASEMVFSSSREVVRALHNWKAVKE
jgi:hypothetical protein